MHMVANALKGKAGGAGGIPRRALVDCGAEETLGVLDFFATHEMLVGSSRVEEGRRVSKQQLRPSSPVWTESRIRWRRVRTTRRLATPASQAGHGRAAEAPGEG